MTEAERLLWSKIRMKQLKGLHFYRQRIIANYIVDFYPVRKKASPREITSYLTGRGKKHAARAVRRNISNGVYCPKAKLVIELDGGQHYSDDGIMKDKNRDEYMKDQGA